MGILQLGGGSQVISILEKDMMADLVPAMGKRSGTRGGSGGAKDATIYYVPSLEGLMEKHDAWTVWQNTHAQSEQGVHYQRRLVQSPQRHLHPFLPLDSHL